MVSISVNTYLGTLYNVYISGNKYAIWLSKGTIFIRLKHSERDEQGILSKQFFHQLLHLRKVNNLDVEFLFIQLLVEFGDEYFFETELIGFRNALVNPAYRAHL